VKLIIHQECVRLQSHMYKMMRSLLVMSTSLTTLAHMSGDTY